MKITILRLPFLELNILLPCQCGFKAPHQPTAIKVTEFLWRIPGRCTTCPTPTSTAYISRAATVLPDPSRAPKFVHIPGRGWAHLGLGASSPSICSSCSGPRQFANPRREAAHCAPRTAASCNSGSAQWLPCRTGPRACQETERGAVRPGKTDTHPEETDTTHPPPWQDLQLGRLTSTKGLANGQDPTWWQDSPRFSLLYRTHQETQKPLLQRT